MYYDIMETQLGPLLVAGDAAGVRQIVFQAGTHPLAIPPHWMRDPDAAREATRQLTAYFEGTLRTFDLPIAPVGTAFQQQVWQRLLTIPYGTTASYRDIARGIGKPTACRAVGMANGRNPIPVIIPCHRVIGADATLTGYGGGLHLKEGLLKIEGLRIRHDRNGKDCLESSYNQTAVDLEAVS